MFNYTATYTDQYQLTMAQVFFQNGRSHHRAVFDYFFRKLPFGGGYAILAGIEDLLDILEALRFSDHDLSFLLRTGFSAGFVDYLKDFRFTGCIRSSAEGDLVFPYRPVLQVEADIIEAQIIETLLLNLLNFQTLIATKASRMKLAAADRKLIDFGLRRAQGPAGYYASRAAVIGGFDATSNVLAGIDYGIPVSGTMAHSFVQSYDDELSAFRDFARERPDDCVLLVDTYNTLRSGMLNAITVGKEMAGTGGHLKGIRLDSGDLAYLSKECRRMLDDAGLDNVQIAASNQLDEYVIKSLMEQRAPIDVFGVGTSMVIGRPDAALDGVYKLAFSDGKPRIKVSETAGKTTLPHKKQVYRIKNSTGQCIGADVISLPDEHDVPVMFHPMDPLKSLPLKGFIQEPLLMTVFEAGRRTAPARPLEEIAEYSQNRLNELPAEYKRFENPHLYKIGISETLKHERDRLIEHHKTQL
ncbi:MAG TPA: nicotinate phosphoribosyltransferase [Sphingobacteriaceae bacterium]